MNSGRRRSSSGNDGCGSSATLGEMDRFKAILRSRRRVAVGVRNRGRASYLPEHRGSTNLSSATGSTDLRQIGTRELTYRIDHSLESGYRSSRTRPLILYLVN